LAVGSKDLSQAEKEIIVCQAEQIHKMTIIFTQNGLRLLFCVKIVVILFNLNRLASISFFMVDAIPLGKKESRNNGRSAV
jgi:hypothetical protein